MILCCGEALVDMIPERRTNGPLAFVPHCGGAVFNTAIALGRLGAEVGMLTGLSTDRFGQMLHQTLCDNRVDPAHVIRSDRLTTLAMVHLVDGDATYAFYDENSAGRMITYDDLPQLPERIGALFFGGISLVSDPAASAYAALLAQQAADRIVMIDPNIRPAFIEDEAAYRARLGQMLDRADIIKLSEDDLDWLATEGRSAEQTLTDLRNAGPKIIVLTRGGDGVTGYWHGQTIEVPAVPTTPVDTVGAGDTFNAGLLASLSKQGYLTAQTFGTLTSADLRAAIAFGAQAASVTVSRAGANPPWSHELPGQ